MHCWSIALRVVLPLPGCNDHGGEGGVKDHNYDVDDHGDTVAMIVMVMVMVMVVIINIINRCTFFKTVYCSHRERKILARLAQQK